MAALLWPGLALACVFPDSSRGSEAPAWVCEPAWPDVALAAVGSRSHMPSISTQNRIAGREAMLAVAVAVRSQAREQLEALAGRPLELSAAPWEDDDLALLQATPGIRVYARRRSPGRTLYVLAGVEAERLPPLFASHRRAWLDANAPALRELLGDAALAELRQRAAGEEP